VTATSAPPRKRGWGLSGGSTSGLISKIALLAFVAAIAVAMAFPLIANAEWLWLGVLVVVTAAIFFVYLQPWHIPLKYLVPGTIFLVAFQVVPVVATAGTSFTNYGDGHSGSKEDAIASIQTASVQQVPGSAQYVLTIATSGSVESGPLVFLLYDPTTKTVQQGTDAGLTPCPECVTGPTGKVTQAPAGLTILNLGQAAARSKDVQALTVPTSAGAIKASGVSKAYEAKPTSTYDATCDCITDVLTGTVYKADNSRGLFVDAATNTALPQGWQVNVGLSNYVAAFTDPSISGPFLGILMWNFSFAILSVLITFTAGLLVAMALNSPRLRALRFYRILIVLPYAMPSFAMLLVWRDMFNTDFGLVNQLIGQPINWFGDVWTARLSILIIQFWLGYPYMFLVTLGALQSIPADLTEAAAVDGARRFQAFRAVVFPLLLVSVAPLLISSFAFNFNNFNVIQLTTGGAPFPPDNVKAGGTDLLVSYTYRLAFAPGGAQYGFAAAISVLIFLIVAVFSFLGFRRTASLEEINR
jgi:arabinogalactan oligomer / maltooligosaccharide transport system permease protein